MKDRPDKLLAACVDAMRAAGAEPAIRLRVPGRVELLGKHTDYAGGRSVVLAADRAFRAAAVRRADRLVRMIPADRPGEAVTFAIAQRPDQPPGHWAHYAATVARRLAANFDSAAELRGADIAFLSDLPPAAGMSSGSALLITVALALIDLNELELSEPWSHTIRGREDLAMYLACVENGQSFAALGGEAGVGTFGGSEDHTAILCAQAGKLSIYSYAPTRFEQTVAWPTDIALAVATCGVAAEKTGGRLHDYNHAAERARLAVETYNRTYGTQYRHLRDLLHGYHGPADDVRAFLDGLCKTEPTLEGMGLGERFEQFWREDQIIIPQAMEAFARADWEAFGRLCDQSHHLADEFLENQIPQTNALQHLARTRGALAASAFGAGFGGSVWAVVHAGEIEGFLRAWRQAYRAEFPDESARAEFFRTRPGGPAAIL